MLVKKCFDGAVRLLSSVICVTEEVMRRPDIVWSFCEWVQFDLETIRSQPLCCFGPSWRQIRLVGKVLMAFVKIRKSVMLRSLKGVGMKNRKGARGGEEHIQ